MAYIGPEPNPGQNREVDDISGSFNGSTTAFTLQVNSQNVSPGSSNAIIVSLGGVVQNPGTDYTVAASTLTFTTAPASGLSFFGLVLGQQVDTADANFNDPVITGDLSIADKIVHTGDTNTAIRFPEADNVTVECAGNERFRVKPTNDVAIFTGSSSATLTVRNDTANEMQIHTGIGDALIFGTNGENERIRIDSDGRLGVGTTSPLSYAGATITNDNGLAIQGSSQTRLLFRHDNAGSNNKLMDLAFDEGRIKIRQINDDTTTATELYRFRSDGQFCIGTTGDVTSSTGGATFRNISDNRRQLMLGVTSSSERALVEFFNSNGGVGSINTNGSSTAYNTSSDYRLKENVVPISDGITRLKTLKPSRFNFKADVKTVLDGFLAHEVIAVPEAITGTKDEIVTQQLIDRGDKEQSELGDPIYQSIDQSKLVPLLTAALQEAVTKIETLETKVAALEAA